MVLFEVFSHSVKIRYLTSIFSRASLVQIVCIVLSLLGPFLVAYYTGGFWIKDKQDIEQATVNFQYRYICLLEDDTNVYLSSSYQNLNEIYSNIYMPSTRKISEFDTNGDGFNDLLEFNLSITIIPTSTTNIKSIKLLLVFNVALSVYAGLSLESIGYLESYNSIGASGVDFSGQLDFVQKNSLRSNVVYNFTTTLLNQNSIDLNELNLPKIVRDYNSRDYATRLVTDQVSWKNLIADGFDIRASIRYAPFNVSYVPGFWEQFKWGWIQYVAVLLPFLFVFKLAKIFIFENQLVPTIVVDPAHKIKVS